MLRRLPHPRRLSALVLATTASQAVLVVLAPLVVAIGEDLDASVSAIGQARSILAAAAVGGALVVGGAIDRFGLRPVLVTGALLAVAGQGATAAAPSLGLLYAAHAVTGLAVACLLSAGFAGVAAWFDDEDGPRVLGYVVGAQSISWIVGNPIIGFLADAGSWRLAYAVPAAMALLALAAALAAPSGRPAWTGEQASAGLGLGVVLRNRSARRWALAELVAYAAWTAELTYIGAFYITSYGISESAVGVLLAVGSVCFLVSTLGTQRVLRRVRRRTLVVAGALGMGVMLVPIMNLTPSVWFTLALFCPMALFAGLRTTSSSALGLDQLPARPGSMMAARTASAQLGYMAGAAWGGIVLAVGGFGTLGFVLLGGMALSALLVLRVDDRVPVQGE